MSHIVYDFLADSLFFDKSALKTSFKNESDSRIEKELIDYRNHVINNLDNIKTEINATPSELNVFTSAEKTPVDLLKQTALYLNQYVVADSLFRLTNLESPMEKAMSSYMGFNEKLSRESIKKNAAYFKELTPMVTGNFIKVFPVSFYFEVPKLMPLKMPVDNNRGLLPPDILKFFHEHSAVSPMEQLPDNKGWAIYEGKALKPVRAINVEFDTKRFQNGYVYFLYESKILSVNEEERTFTQTQYLPPYPPNQEFFDAWVEQSVNSAAKNYFDRAFGEVYMAENLGARYISESAFKNELLSQNVEIENDIQTFTTNQMLNINLPFLDKVDAGKLMQVRENEAEVFTNFRMELEKQFRELRLVKDEKDLKVKTENFFHELNEVQGQKINQRMKHIRKQMFINSALAVGSFAASVTTGGLSLAGVAVATAKGYKDYRDYIQYVKENPAYFLWKTQKR